MKRDFNLDNFEDRLEHINNTYDIENYDRKKWIEARRDTKSGEEVIGGVDYMLENIGIYLLRAKDIESERDLEYSFFRDDSEFKKEYWSKRKDVFDDDDRDYPLSEDYNYRSSLTDFRVDCEDIKNSGDPWRGVSDKIKDQAEYVFNKMMSSAEDDLDFQIIDLLLDGKNAADIAREMGQHYNTIRYRIGRLTN